MSDQNGEIPNRESSIVEELDLEVDVEMPNLLTEGQEADECILLQRSTKPLTSYSKKKYFPYHLKVDPDQDDRANEIKLCSVRRPHMRAFHFSWWCYHVAFLMW